MFAKYSRGQDVRWFAIGSQKFTQMCQNELIRIYLTYLFMLVVKQRGNALAIQILGNKKLPCRAFPRNRRCPKVPRVPKDPSLS